MNSPIRALVREYGWIHLSLGLLGLLGNIGFFVGSLFFLPSLEQYKALGVWLFIVGSFFMLIGALGHLLVDVTDET